MKKYFFSLLITMAVSVVTFGQTTKQKTDQLKNDPQTKEAAAKADAQLIDKRNIVDTVHSNVITSKRKHVGCKFKRKQKSALHK